MRDGEIQQLKIAIASRRYPTWQAPSPHIRRRYVNIAQSCSHQRGMPSIFHMAKGRYMADRWRVVFVDIGGEGPEHVNESQPWRRELVFYNRTALGCLCGLDSSIALVSTSLIYANEGCKPSWHRSKNVAKNVAKSMHGPINYSTSLHPLILTSSPSDLTL
jgi:hypothetical protein